jgi:hypothetical protein
VPTAAATAAAVTTNLPACIRTMSRNIICSGYRALLATASFQALSRPQSDNHHTITLHMTTRRSAQVKSAECASIPSLFARRCQNGFRYVSVWSHSCSCGPGAGQARPGACLLCRGHTSASCCECNCCIRNCPCNSTRKCPLLSRFWLPCHCCRPLNFGLCAPADCTQCRSAAISSAPQN